MKAGGWRWAAWGRRRWWWWWLPRGRWWRRRRIFWWVWYDLHSDLTRLNCHVAGDAGAELSEDRWSWSQACQGPWLISMSNDDAWGDISSHTCRAVGVIHDREQLQDVIPVSIPDKDGREGAERVSLLLWGVFLQGLLLKLLGLLTDWQLGLFAAAQGNCVWTLWPSSASHGWLEELQFPVGRVHESPSPLHLTSVQSSVNASRHWPAAARPCWVGRWKGELPFIRVFSLHEDLGTAEGAAVVVHGVVGGEWVAVREEGHVALWLG